MMDLRSSSLVLKPRQFQEMKGGHELCRTRSSSGARSRRARLNIHEIFIVFGAITGQSIVLYFSVEVSVNFLGILVKWGLFPFDEPWLFGFLESLSVLFIFLTGGGDLLIGVAITFVLGGELFFDGESDLRFVGVDESELVSFLESHWMHLSDVLFRVALA
ncbi:hypothetical protein TNCV_3465301 [Trichonephila clavipes]|nr:hypothetical protein TNCV_3465301 [Trichonephila clavipes]